MAPHKLGADFKWQNVDEIEWRQFLQMLWAGEFLLGAQSLMKLTRGGKNFQMEKNSNGKISSENFQME